jgi:hypothetical protein
VLSTCQGFSRFSRFSLTLWSDWAIKCQDVLSLSCIPSKPSFPNPSLFMFTIIRVLIYFHLPIVRSSILGARFLFHSYDVMVYLNIYMIVFMRTKWDRSLQSEINKISQDITRYVPRVHKYTDYLDYSVDFLAKMCGTCYRNNTKIH